MPIKLPKGFQRRKSSGNALDEINDGQPSFRVIARPNSSGRSLDAGSTLAGGPGLGGKPLPPPKSSFEEDSEDLFSAVNTGTDAANRGSGGTNNSLSTRYYDSANSSARLSTSSTNPSSVDNRSDRYVQPQRPIEDVPVPPPHSSRAAFLKNAGRTFSFGLNKGSRESNDLAQTPSTTRSRAPTVSTARERAMTVSSVTTAHAPQLDGHTFSLDKSDMDDFGNMFETIGSKPRRESQNLTSAPRNNVPRPTRAAAPLPIDVDNSAHIDPSPYSWHSENSRNGLIRSPSPSRTVTQNSPQPTTRSPYQPVMTRSQTETSMEESMLEDTPLHNAWSHESSKSPTGRAPPPSSFPGSAIGRARGMSQPSSIKSPNSMTSPTLDPALLANVQLAAQYEQKPASPVITQQSNKVMTPAEFEKYRRQKEDTRRYNKVFGKADSDQDDSGDDYEDDSDDDKEREMKAVQQRKKQEAHLAVYRQQMMKVTGEKPSDLPRPESGMSSYNPSSSSNLDLPGLNSNRMSSVTVTHSPDEDEDEEVPLGILAAHGFPSKNRPPMRLTSSSSNPNLRQISQTSGGVGSVMGDGGRGPLPAFARHLPADPYYGAGIVAPSIRESISMHAPQQMINTPQASGAATQHPLHPAGLVGVIAGEERARAMRRGSPNPQGSGFDLPHMPPQNNMRGFPMGGQGMMLPGQPPMLSPAEQAQLQMSQSMTQMMQMQMQWMQQMSSMMAQGGNQQQMGMMPGMMPGMMGMPGVPGMSGMPQMQGPPRPPSQAGSIMNRPSSVPLQSYGNRDARTMSTLNPHMAPWNASSPAIPTLGQMGNGGPYAHSIAPSERSNIGLASRYRPVSTMQQEPEPSWAKRASTFTSSTFKPWASENPSKMNVSSTVRAVQSNDDEDDEQGWAEMKARKDKKSKSWKLRKGGNTLQELYNAPA